MIIMSLSLHPKTSPGDRERDGKREAGREGEGRKRERKRGGRERGEREREKERERGESKGGREKVASKTKKRCRGDRVWLLNTCPDTWTL